CVARHPTNRIFKFADETTVIGLISDNNEVFNINIGTDKFTNIGLHFSPRFDYGGDHNRVVCNTFQDGNWGEEVKWGSFPFCQGQEFKVIIDFTPTEFVVTLSDDSVINFPNRFNAKEYSAMNLLGKVRFTSLQIKQIPILPCA
uniref:Galectin n=1 Tax=Salarias fasciatus TaxID=181472 RepID=A0A672FP16_SALFA